MCGASCHRTIAMRVQGWVVPLCKLPLPLCEEPVPCCNPGQVGTGHYCPSPTESWRGKIVVAPGQDLGALQQPFCKKLV